MNVFINFLICGGGEVLHLLLSKFEIIFMALYAKNTT